MARTPSKIGKYTIEEKIAEGGMGAVFKGMHPTLEQPVVLKKLTLNNSEHLTERFRREAKIMIEFSHENIVRVYDHFKQASSYYIVQEFVDGCSVDILLKKERYLDINVGLYIFYHSCMALQYAHNRQVIHRDIKPANIMVSRNGEIKLVDFGIAQADSEEDALTKDGMTLGTPSYMAPEQFEDSRNVTCQADIYSLGVMLYEMLTGKKPFPGKINPETILKIQKGRYASPKKLQPEIPGFVNSIIKSCMQAQLKKRPKSIAALMKKLNRWYQTAPVEDIRQNLVALINGEPMPQDTGKYRSKKQRLKSIGIGLVLLVILGAGFLGYARGLHYRYLLNRTYGGIKILLEIPNPLKDRQDMYIHSTLYTDDNREIPIVPDTAIRYRISEETENLLQLEAAPVYLNPGTYRIKTIIDGQVIWSNFYLDPINNSGSLFDSGTLTPVHLSWSPYEPLPLTIEMKVEERNSGYDLSDTARITILRNSDYVELDKLDETLMTDEVYKIRISAEGYYTNDYVLKILPYQTILQLDAQLVPLEGFLKIEGLDPGIKFRINGRTSVLTGGFPGENLILTERENPEKALPLSPSEYTLSFEYKKKTIEHTVNIQAGQTVLLKLETTDDKESPLIITEELK